MPSYKPRPAEEPSGPEYALAPAVLFVHLALSPLIFTTCTLEVFEYPKTSLLVLAAIVLGALGLSALIRRAAPTGARQWFVGLPAQAAAVARDPLALGFLCFLASAALSTATSSYPRISF